MSALIYDNETREIRYYPQFAKEDAPLPRECFVWDGTDWYHHDVTVPVNRGKRHLEWIDAEAVPSLARGAIPMSNAERVIIFYNDLVFLDQPTPPSSNDVPDGAYMVLVLANKKEAWYWARYGSFVPINVGEVPKTLMANMLLLS